MELYIHIPYCAQKCAYCDFASYAGMESTIDSYISAVLAEGRQRNEQLHNPVIDTVFIGGGTPSLLSAEKLARLLEGIRKVFNIKPGAEFTSEANPGTVNPEWLRAAADAGVNRISMGMQAAQESLLQVLGRIHHLRDVEESVEMCRKVGISNINLDLMFGIPTQTAQMWEETLRTALSLDPTHLSCYSLILEDGTRMKADVDAGRLSLPTEDEERQMYDTAITLLQSAGYGQYEISNFAKSGFRCAHNLGYWRQIPYIGLGASAASMVAESGEQFSYRREMNPPEIDAYMADTTHTCREVEKISPAEAQYETMMLGLRTTDGVSEEYFRKLHGTGIMERFGEKLKKIEIEGLITRENSCWHLTRMGLDVQNYVLVELMDD